MIVRRACATSPLFKRLAVATLSAALFLPPPLDAQIRGSERSRISQMSDGTTVIIDYARPHVRGRLPIFGGLVGWGHVWTPGANEATTFEVDNDVRLNGVDVAAGRYSVWLIPAEGPWELVLDPNDRLYHTQPPEESDGQVRMLVTPEETEFTEALTWEFPLVETTGMALRFRWAETSIPLEIEVPPSRALSVSAEAAAQLTGTYEMTFQGPPPPEAPPDAVPPVMSVELRYEDDALVGTLGGGPPGMPNEFTLIPVAEHVFNPAWMMEGAIFETEVDMYFEFNVEDGQAAGFDVRGLEDRLMMRGRRTG